MSHAKQRKTSRTCAVAVMTVAGLATALLAPTNSVHAQSPGVPSMPRSAPGASGGPSGLSPDMRGIILQQKKGGMDPNEAKASDLPSKKTPPDPCQFQAGAAKPC